MGRAGDWPARPCSHGSAVLDDVKHRRDGLGSLKHHVITSSHQLGRCRLLCIQREVARALTRSRKNALKTLSSQRRKTHRASYY